MKKKVRETRFGTIKEALINSEWGDERIDQGYRKNIVYVLDTSLSELV